MDEWGGAKHPLIEENESGRRKFPLEVVPHLCEAGAGSVRDTSWKNATAGVTNLTFWAAQVVISLTDGDRAHLWGKRGFFAKRYVSELRRVLLPPLDACTLVPL